jgi:MraZ protein
MSKTVKVDNKGRLKVPANLIATLTKSGAEFFITSEDGDHARIYPRQVWTDIEKRLVHVCSYNRHRQKLLTRAKYFGRAVIMDDQGRVLIPAVLRETARLHGEVDVLDYENYLEVWNHSRLMNNLKRHPVTKQDESVLERLTS